MSHATKFFSSKTKTKRKANNMNWINNLFGFKPKKKSPPRAPPRPISPRRAVAPPRPISPRRAVAVAPPRPRSLHRAVAPPVAPPRAPARRVYDFPVPPTHLPGAAAPPPKAIDFDLDLLIQEMMTHIDARAKRHETQAEIDAHWLTEIYVKMKMNSENNPFTDDDKKNLIAMATAYSYEGNAKSKVYLPYFSKNYIASQMPMFRGGSTKQERDSRSRSPVRVGIGRPRQTIKKKTKSKTKTKSKSKSKGKSKGKQ